VEQVDKEIVKRMKEVEKAVLGLDESVRSAAFSVMRDYILEGAATDSSRGEQNATPRSRSGGPAAKKKTSTKIVAPEGYDAFIDEFESGIPNENARAIAAHLYREYGIEPFSLDEVRDLATKGGVTIPSRIDMTFLSAKANKKKLFKRAGTGRFRPTVYGEAHFKETYGVKKGTKKRPEVES
jgi:hypothetical protein